MDYIKVRVATLVIGQDIVWRGKVCRVVERLGPVTVKVREYERKKVAERKFKDKWYTIQGDVEVDKVIT